IEIITTEVENPNRRTRRSFHRFTIALSQQQVGDRAEDKNKGIKAGAYLCCRGESKECKREKLQVPAVSLKNPEDIPAFKKIPDVKPGERGGATEQAISHPLDWPPLAAIGHSKHSTLP